MPTSIYSGGATTNFTYDGDNVRAKKVSPDGTTLYFGDHYEVIEGNPTQYIFAGNIRVAMIDGSGTHYYHKDHLGNTSIMTDSEGSDEGTTDYMPFGTIRSQTEESHTSYMFTDQELDNSTNLYNYDARLYDPVIGRFISADTTVQDWYNPQSLNRYSYCLNNPLIYVDPSGHYVWVYYWSEKLDNGDYLCKVYIKATIELHGSYASPGYANYAKETFENKVTGVYDYEDKKGVKTTYDVVMEADVTVREDKWSTVPDDGTRHQMEVRNTTLGTTAEGDEIIGESDNPGLTSDVYSNLGEYSLIHEFFHNMGVDHDDDDKSSIMYPKKLKTSNKIMGHHIHQIIDTGGEEHQGYQEVKHEKHKKMSK